MAEKTEPKTKQVQALIVAMLQERRKLGYRHFQDTEQIRHAVVVNNYKFTVSETRYALQRLTAKGVLECRTKRRGWFVWNEYRLIEPEQ